MAKAVTELEYLGMSGWQKFCYRFVTFFQRLPAVILNFFRVTIPGLGRRIWNAIKSVFRTIWNAAAHGDWKTRFSFVIFGFSQFANKQIMRGLLFFVFEFLFIIYMSLFGAGQLRYFSTLGEVERTKPGWGPNGEMIEGAVGDHSLLILLYGLLTILFILAFIYAWYASVKSAYAVQQYKEANQHLSTAKEDIKRLADAQYHKTLLTGPLIGLTIFTILPILFMIFIAFTNYDIDHLAPEYLFTWSGFNNFKALFDGSYGKGVEFGRVFGQLLLWTVIWAFFATFSNYIVGMIVALMINKKGIRLKKLWRTVLIMTIAVPQFVSLLLMSNMLGDEGVINKLLQSWGIIGSPIKFLSDKYLVKVTVIVVNMWIGIPYTMLMVSGILMNIPADLYESARIDGAGPVKMYFKITLPYVFHVTTPYLISTFVGNLNNFGVIYLLSGGGPTMSRARSGGAGESDLLITWLYKLITDKKTYGVASVISILMFLFTSILSLIVYNRSKAVKNEEDFM